MESSANGAAIPTQDASTSTSETVDTRSLWSIESAVQWGKRNGLDGQLSELQEFASIIKSVEISGSDLEGRAELDSGSFGTIDRSSLRGTPVAVKRFIKVDFSPF
jgi:hypothetical protein